MNSTITPLKKSLLWLTGIVVTTIITVVITKLVEQGLENLDLIGALKATSNTLWNWAKALSGMLYWFIGKWIFAFILGVGFTLVVQKIVREYRENNPNTSNSQKYRYPEWSERDNIAKTLGRMASWAEDGFCEHDLDYGFGRTNEKWYVANEVNIENLVDALEGIGVFLPPYLSRLPRGKRHIAAVPVYTRLASYFTSDRIEKARNDYPALD